MINGGSDDDERPPTWQPFLLYHAAPTATYTPPLHDAIAIDSDSDSKSLSPERKREDDVYHTFAPCYDLVVTRDTNTHCYAPWSYFAF